MLDDTLLVLPDPHAAQGLPVAALRPSHLTVLLGLPRPTDAAVAGLHFITLSLLVSHQISRLL
jgi:hypothetical protein